MKKNAQAQQVFTYIFAIVVIGAIVLFGYKAFNNMRDKAENVAYLTFQTDLTNAVDSMSYSYGSVSKKILTVPSGYEEVCFVDLDCFAEKKCTFDDDFKYPIIKNYVESGAKENVFLKDKSFYGGNITVVEDKDGFDCITVARGKLNLRIEGIANSKAQISKWEND